jgi:ribosomal protein L14E/L6E/L27E
VLKEKSIVESIKGHDKGRLYVVIKLEYEFAYLCDGDYRTFDNPKKKRVKHLKDTYQILDTDKEIDDLYDFEIKTILKSFKNKNCC